MRNNPNRAKKKFPVIRIMILVFSLVLLTVSSFELYAYYKDNSESDRKTDTLREQAVVSIAPAMPADPSISESKPVSDPEDPLLPVPGKYPPISYTIPLMVDFPLLQEQNPDIIAWIYSEGTTIDYPVVHSHDNNDYLNRLIDGTYNPNGSIFVDFRNVADFSDSNTLVYGHNMINGTMFSSLINYKKQSYYEAHPNLWILTPERAYRVDLIAGMTIPSDSEIYTIFDSQDDMMEVLEDAVARSTFQSDVPLEDIERIVTLSTCTYDYNTARYVVIGKLVPADYLSKEELEQFIQATPVEG